jgi:hypothetical protein
MDALSVLLLSAAFSLRSKRFKTASLCASQRCLFSALSAVTNNLTAEEIQEFFAEESYTVPSRMFVLYHSHSNTETKKALQANATPS